jgi:hypothetical protein
MMGLMVSPLRGADGNVEFLAHLRASPPPGPGVDIVAAVDAVVSEAIALAAAAPGSKQSRKPEVRGRSEG